MKWRFAVKDGIEKHEQQFMDCIGGQNASAVDGAGGAVDMVGQRALL